MLQYDISVDAKSDIAEIKRYTLKVWGKEQWQLYSNQLRKTMLMLAKNSHSGIFCKEIRSDFYRFPLKNHSIYFKRSGGRITIVRVLQNSMCPDRHIASKHE